MKIHYSAPPPQYQSLNVIVTGAAGFVGGAICRALRYAGHNPIPICREHYGDWTQRSEVSEAFASNKLRDADCLIHAAGRVRGILGNQDDHWVQHDHNLLLGTNAVWAAATYGMKAILLGSSCQYPADATLPWSTHDLGGGKLEESNWGYAAAKEHTRVLAMQNNFTFAIPPNLFGPGDNYHPTQSHVFAAMIAKAVSAYEGTSGCVEHWGNPDTKREFLFVPTLAKGLVNLTEELCATENPVGRTINMGLGEKAVLSLGELWEKILNVVGKNPFVRWNGESVGARSKCMHSWMKYYDQPTQSEPIDWPFQIQATVDDYRNNLTTTSQEEEK